MKHLDERIEDLLYTAGRANDTYASRNDEWNYREESHPETVEQLLSDIQHRDLETVTVLQQIEEAYEHNDVEPERSIVRRLREILAQYQAPIE